MKIDKEALGKAVGIMLLSWTALPIVYYLLVHKKGVKEENDRHVDKSGNNGDIDIHSDESRDNQ